jgi:quinate dehydrogenase
MPHKITFSCYTDVLTPEAAAIGAINTLFFRRDAQGQRRCIGTNTDTIGVRESFLRNISASRLERGAGKPALVIGGGGAARAAIYALHIWLGVEEIYVVNRFASEVEDIRKALSTHETWAAKLTYVEDPAAVTSLEPPFLVVGTVPDYPATSDEEKRAQEVTKAFLARTSDAVALEMCYMPKVVTCFYTLAEQAGWTVISGVQAVLWQGIAQEVLWTEHVKVAEPEAFEKANHAVTMRMRELEISSSK